MHKNIRILGAFLGIALALKVLPGISLPDGNEALFSVAFGGAVFMGINQLVHAWPSEIRQTPFVMLLILACAGIVEDTLIWLLLSWLSVEIGVGLHVDGTGAALLGGVITRLVVLALLALPPRTGDVREEGSGSTA